MRVRSFMRQGSELVPVEVELTLVPGLPQISFLGLPDAVIRESVLRIKSALRWQEFEMPKAQQILVQLRPSHLRKTSRGLDLAVAAALLWETRQIEAPPSHESFFLYGELSLKGEVLRPDDIEDVDPSTADLCVWTGMGAKPEALATVPLQNLRSLTQPPPMVPAAHAEVLIRPALGPMSVAPEVAHLMSVIAAGEHAALLAGPPGSGKTTVAERLHPLLQDPTPERMQSLRRIHRLFGDRLVWRPLVQPHHSITPLAMIGGGVPPRPGEITRAHGGLLLMDEFLEFHPRIQEALREPMESGRIRLARSNQTREYPAEGLLIATTNLCPCGRFVPRKGNGCRCRPARRERYLSRLAGPFLDRFTILAFTDGWVRGDRLVALPEIREKVERAVQFREASRKQFFANGRLSADATTRLLSGISPVVLPEEGGSLRRRQSLLRVARTLADLESSEDLKPRHLEQAREITVDPFLRINRERE